MVRIARKLRVYGKLRTKLKNSTVNDQYVSDTQLQGSNWLRTGKIEEKKN